MMLLPWTRQDVQTLKPLVVLVGPTAIGKSRVAIEVAQALQTEILTADSRQVYRGMDIGTDKPTMAERRGIPHLLIDLVNPDQAFNVGEYRRRAINEIARLHGMGKVPVIAGGTGLYVRAVLRGLWPGPQADWTLRAQMAEDAREHGMAHVYRELVKVDPILASRLHPHDWVKVQRALEVYRVSGVPLSQAHRQHGFQESPYRAWVIGLTMNRESLYKRIDSRVDHEIAKGLIQETQRLLDRGYARTLGSMKGLGYRQMAGFLHGEYAYEEAVRILKRDTRHFAKRQMTWFRKEPGIRWIQVDEVEPAQQVADRVLSLVRRLADESESTPDSGKPAQGDPIMNLT